MLKRSLGFWKADPQYAYKRYAYKKPMYITVKRLKSDWNVFVFGRAGHVMWSFCSILVLQVMLL